MPNSDAVGNSLGPFGKWQLRSTLLIYLVKIPAAWFMACLIFTAKSPTSEEIYCKPSYEVKNITAWIELAHRKRFNTIENEDSFNICLVKENITDEIYGNYADVNHTFVECAGFEHRPTFHSIIHQYGLICSREALVALSQSLHLLGVLLGGLIAFYMLKRISPRRVMLVGMVAQIFLGPLTGFAPNYELHLLFRCCAAATCSMMCIGIMIVSDITSGKYRVIGVCLFEQFWSVGVILLPAVSSWWSLWSTTYIAISLPTVGLIILWYWIPDSPRWLLKHGRVEEALQVLKDAARVNGKNNFSEDDMYKKLAELAEVMRYDPPEPTYLSIWRVPTMIKLRLFVAHMGWSVYLMCYYASLLNVRAMGRKYLQVNTVLAGVSEIVGTFVGLFLILKTGRKWTYMSQFNIALSIIAYSANYLPLSFPPLERMIIYMIGTMLFKVAISTSVAMFNTSMVEIVSPDKRAMCNHSGVTCSRTLVIIAPFIGYFVVYGQFVPQTIMCVMSICNSLVVAVFIKTPRTVPVNVKTTILLHEKQVIESFIKK